MKVNKTLCSAIATSAIVAGCASQAVVSSVPPVDRENKLMVESKNKYGIESFDEITTNDYRNAFLKGVAEQKENIRKIVANKAKPTFENTIVALEKSSEQLLRAEMTFSPLESSNSTDSTRALSRELSPVLSAHSDEIYMNSQLFERVKTVYDEMAQSDLDREQQKLVEKIYKAFVRSGANLSDAEKVRLSELNMMIDSLQLEFRQNLLYETNNTFVVVDKLSDLAGLSQANIDRAAQMAKDNGLEGHWMFNMQRSSCNPVLQYCSNRELRRKVYDAYYNRGNKGGEHDNRDICRQLVTLRLERAKLMGF